MNATTQSHNGFSQRTKTSIKREGETSSVQTQSPASTCKVYLYENYVPKEAEVPAGFSDIESLVAHWERDPARARELEGARRWLADSGLVGEEETLRSLRLQKGWSQQRLADEINTSQSHIARIERGTENIAIQTCRRLAMALEVDLTRLDQALRAQESLAQSHQA